MNTVVKNSKHRLLVSLFYIFETVFVASFAAIMIEYFHSPGSDTSVVFLFSFWISLLALLAVCFRIRRKRWQLAVIGWVTAFILVLAVLMMPQI